MDTNNFTETLRPKYDLHLSAHSIKPATIKRLEGLGFKRDTFANNRYCDTTAYHATFDGWVANDDLWQKITFFLHADETFNGGLEEELVLKHYRKVIGYTPNDFRPASTKDILKFFKDEVFPKEKAIPCPPNVLKECDIHISVDWHYAGKTVKKALDALEIVSFDKPWANGAKNRFNRIFTLTFENLAKGIHCFDRITRNLEFYNDNSGKNLFYLKFCGKVKLEITTRIFRQPLNGILLPLIVEKQPNVVQPGVRGQNDPITNHAQYLREI